MKNIFMSKKSNKSFVEKSVSWMLAFSMVLQGSYALPLTAYATNGGGSTSGTATIVANKIVCDNESDLPNWGAGAPDIKSSTASEFLATHPNCRAKSGWKFQSAASGTANPGDQTGFASGWAYSPLTDASGMTSWTFTPSTMSGLVWVREVMNAEYIPFTGLTTTANVSAELYCSTDGLNYDNYDFIGSPVVGKTYYCVGFNVLKATVPPPPSVSCPFVAAPNNYVINYGAAKFIRSDSTHADANVSKDVAIPAGEYEVSLFSYDSYPTRVSSSQPKEQWYLRLNDAAGLIASSAAIGDLADNVETATRMQVVGTVNVSRPIESAMAKHAAWSDTSSPNSVYPICAQLKKVLPPPENPECSDGKDNDGDGKKDFPLDLGCENTDDNDENNKPVITLRGANPLPLAVGATYVEPRADVADAEDGDIDANLVITGSVNTSVVGSYTITYNAKDSKNLAADTKTRTVTVLAQCADGIDNDGDSKIDYPADESCDNEEDNDENTKPVITLRGTNPSQVTLGESYTEASADVADAEDGDIDANLVTTGTVNTAVIGAYTITYNAADSKGLAADTKTRTVNVVAACSDGRDNDGDTLVDFPLDLGCGTPDDNDENTKPVITLSGANPFDITQGGTWSELGFTANDAEDGDITVNVIVTGTVDTATVGSYTLSYNVVDSKSLAADTKTRIVRVNPALTECNDNIDNDGDNSIDFDGAILEGDMAFVPDAGCESLEDNSENEAPVITVIGTDPLEVKLGTVYADAGRTAADPEDGDITGSIIDSGDTVNTAVLGSYVVKYNVVDSKGLAAVEKSRTVKVVTSCSDGRDNDGDTLVDFPLDPACTTPEDDSENSRPVISLLGDVVMSIVAGTTYTEPSATVADAEDGNITTKLITLGTVNSSTVGTYTITYNATDSQDLAAIEKTRTVNVTSAGCTENCGGGTTPPQCSDGGDNDGDALADFPRDPGCDSPQDNDERDIGPTLTLVGANPMNVIVGGTFTDPGATANDPEDGNITSRIVVTGSVNMSTVGTYTLSYNVSDTQGHAATPVSRTVNVNNGGGGGGPTSLSIMNEKVVSTGTTTVVVTWNTNLPATSRVAYGLDPVTSLAAAPLYGYSLTTITSTTLTTTHSMTIEGVPSAVSAYFRPVSTTSSQVAVGIELTRGGVLGESTECTYLREYMRLGKNNNPVEVTKLQSFLRNYEGFTTLEVNGFFDIATDRAVRAFQDKYSTDVLSTWNLPANTGYVYYTTQKKINEIYCQRAFPLNVDQLTEITAFRTQVKQAVGGVATPKVALVETTGESTEGVVAGASTLSAVGPVVTVEAMASDKPTRGRIALADLLATNPMVGDKLSMESKEEGVDIEQISVEDERMMAGVGSVDASEGFCLGMSKTTLIISLVLLLLLIAVIALIMRRRNKHNMEIGQ